MRGSDQNAVRMNVEELDRFLAREFPQVFNADSGLVIEQVRPGGCRVRQRYQERFLRPGGTISGPTMMALADFAFYVALLAAIGPAALAVTTNLSINFLRKPGQGDLLAEVGILKLGKRLAVMQAEIFAETGPEPVAHVVATYSIPA